MRTKLISFFICLTTIFTTLALCPNPLAPFHHVLAPSEALWHWSGGEKLNKDKFVGMVSEVLDVMPIVPNSDDLVKLLAETAATESTFGYNVKDRSGKTLGIYQILLSTGKYIMERLQKEPDVYKVLQGYMDEEKSLAHNMTYNLHFQTAMAISYYWLRVGDKLSKKSESLSARAKLYKKEWNTPRGAATVAKYIKDSKLIAQN